jgi:hypothetical protein
MTNDIDIIDDFPGSMLGSGKVGDGIARLSIKKEKVTKGYKIEFDYNLHFHFGLRNKADVEREVQILFDCDEEEKLDRELRYIWTSSKPECPYVMTEVKGSLNSSFPVKYRFRVQVPPLTELRIANYFPLDYPSLERQINEKASRIGCVKKTYGRSVEGRDLYYFELGDVKNRPLLMFVAGYHPPEMDPFATKSIIEALVDDHLKERVLSNFSIVLIPFLNPDGFVHSLQGSNVEGINFHWYFFEGKDESCPEAQALWELCRDVKPIFFMDFHAFTFQSWKARPYSIPTGYLVGDISKKTQSLVNRSLIDLCEGRFSVSEKIMAPDILVTRLRKELGTITSPKFHFNWQDGPEVCAQLSVKVFKAVVEAFEAAGMIRAEEILFEPYGKMKKDSLTELKWSILDFFYFEIRPSLGKFKESLIRRGGNS